MEKKKKKSDLMEIARLEVVVGTDFLFLLLMVSVQVVESVKMVFTLRVDDVNTSTVSSGWLLVAADGEVRFQPGNSRVVFLFFSKSQ